MRRLSVLGVVLMAGAAVAVGPPRPGGEALPAGAVARYGTADLRALCQTLHFTADGQRLVGADHTGLVRVWSASTGKLLEARWLKRPPYQVQGSIRPVRSPDGNALLVGQGDIEDIWDIKLGKRLGARLPGKSGGPYSCATLSRDLRLLLVSEAVKERPGREDGVPGRIGGGLGVPVTKHQLRLWDTVAGEGWYVARDDSSAIGLAISPDSKQVVSSSYAKGTRVRDAGTRKLLWEVPKFNAEQVSFTPDGRYLIAAPGGGQSRWHVWGARDGRPAKGLTPPTVGYAWMFAVSPDGGKLLIPTVTDYVLWGLKEGKVLHRWPGAKQAGRGVFAPDGRSVVTYDTILRRWDVRTGKPLYADVAARGHVAPVEQFFITADGRRMASVGRDETIRIWDVAKAKLLHTVEVGPGPYAAWAVTPDGGVLLGVDSGWAVHRWSLADGRRLKGCLLKEARDLIIRLWPKALRVSADGETLVVSAWPVMPEYALNRYSFSAWDLKTGRLREWGGDPGQGYNGDRTSLSPDGRYAASGGQLYLTATGKRVGLLEEGGGGDHLFSPDGRLLASSTGKGAQVHEVATGRLVCEVRGASSSRAAFSPDGRRLAWASSDRLTVWDLPTGRAVVERLAPRELSRRWTTWAWGGVQFSPDGRRVVTGHDDGTLLAWDVPGANAAGRMTEREAAACWRALGDADPAKAYPALWRLAQGGDRTVGVVDRLMPPRQRVSDAELRALIGDLGSDRFEDRDRASQVLKALGDAAEAALRRARKDDPSPEQRRRLDALLNGLRPTAFPVGEDLRAARAVAVLEGVGSPAARRVLEAWAKRGTERWLAPEAPRALQRLKQR